MRLTLKEKIQLFSDHANEVAFGYCDSGCFWHFHWGNRGTGHMMEGFGKTFQSESPEFEEALDELLAHLRYQGVVNAVPFAERNK